MNAKPKVNAFIPLALLMSVFFLPAQRGAGDTFYVDATNHTPQEPYDTWQTAALNIQDAIDVASSGDEILVTNGVYDVGGRFLYDNTSNRVAVDGSFKVRSVNGPQFTVIKGWQVPGLTNGAGAIRGVYLADGAVLSGFTITGGATAPGEAGGGIYCASTSSTVTNCIIAGNSADGNGGGVESGRLDHCTLTANTAASGGGASDSTLTYCILTNNLANEGGGAYYATLDHCTLFGNSAELGGGASGSTLAQCTLSGNFAREGGAAYYCALNDSALSGNSAAETGGGSYDGVLNNCTLTDNSCAGWGGGAAYGTLNNCIIYYNTALGDGSNYWGGSAVLNYCCTTPQPMSGWGHITNAPGFVDSIAGNLRLQANSPCINAGNNACTTNLTDLDGNPRIVSRTVDLGAYEFQGTGSLISYAWLQQYGLPTDGSADSADPDHDRMNNWQEWLCGTDPSDPISVLRLLSVAPGQTNVIVSWQSVGGVTYFVQLATNCSSSSEFISVATDVVGQPDVTSFTHTNVANRPPLFYRVGVAAP